MNEIELRADNMRVLQLFNNVCHQTFQNGILSCWQLKKRNGKEYVTPQSFCCLYCWAYAGMNSRTAQPNAQIAFETAFGIKFANINNKQTYAFAKKLRYAKTFSEKDLKQLAKYIPIN